MFERYTEKARRVIFFARYEASQYGSPYIESEHLLLGILREDKALTQLFFRSPSSVESIRKQIDKQTQVREKTSTRVDLPLSNDCKRVLAYAAEEAERLNDKHIGTEHLLLGLLREEQCFAAVMMKELGLTAAGVRQRLGEIPKSSVQPGVEVESVVRGAPFRDLTQLAIDGKLDPVVGREAEIRAVIEILCSRGKRNAMLLGERGVGKTAIAEGLAQRIADGAVPAPLADKRVLAIEPELLAAWSREDLSKLTSEKLNPSHAILFLDELAGLETPGSKAVGLGASGVLRYALAQDAVQCVGAARAGEYGERMQAMPWLEDCFRVVYVRALDEDNTLKVLLARKGGLEKFHGVTFAEEAVEFAARSAGGPLPGKALELLDAAGALVKLREGTPSGEVAGAQKRIRFIVMRMENAIANHEFEKAKFYSEEESKEREKLRVLRGTTEAADATAVVGPVSDLVGRSEVKEVAARWGKYPYCP